MPLRGHGRAFPERHPPPLPSSSAASPSRLPRTTHAHTTSLPDLPLQAYRVFHGVSEGVPGVTIDKYGDALFVQSWRKPIVRAPR
jgi:23S rRNA G2069 N7-methylase RlmK/C1962 C5-methylase RlmI